LQAALGDEAGGPDALPDAEVLRLFLALHYTQRPPPPLICTNVAPTEAAMLAEALGVSAGRRVVLEVPVRGEKRQVMEQAEANAKILGDAKAAINYENKYTLDYARWRKANPNAYSPFDTTEFNEQWLKQNKLDDFKKEANRNIGYVGQKLPANLSEATHGQAYYLPEQKEVRYLDIRRKDASGKPAPGFVKNDPLAGNAGQ
jgi:lipoprotein-anchoring transpeptidase ErfK/SrfK